MGSGKSVIGRALAADLGRTHVDTDDLVEAAVGGSIDEIFASEGEPGFRAREREALATALAGEPAVVSSGGGIVLDRDNREALARRSIVVWLDASIDALLVRVGDGRGRPLLSHDTETELRAIVEARAPLYAEVADIRIDTSDLIPAAVVERVTAALAEADHA